VWRRVAITAIARKSGGSVKSIDFGAGAGDGETVINITVSLDDETYRRARTIAAQRDTSVSALVKRFLVELAADESDSERLKREERALRDRITAFRASDRLARDELHARER
jgi:hypothetical protein